MLSSGQLYSTKNPELLELIEFLELYELILLLKLATLTLEQTTLFS